MSCPPGYYTGAVFRQLHVTRARRRPSLGPCTRKYFQTTCFYVFSFLTVCKLRFLFLFIFPFMNMISASAYAFWLSHIMFIMCFCLLVFQISLQLRYSFMVYVSAHGFDFQFKYMFSGFRIWSCSLKLQVFPTYDSGISYVFWLSILSCFTIHDFSWHVIVFRTLSRSVTGLGFWIM